jgi:hypothetical protein
MAGIATELERVDQLDEFRPDLAGRSDAFSGVGVAVGHHQHPEAALRGGGLRLKVDSLDYRHLCTHAGNSVGAHGPRLDSRPRPLCSVDACRGSSS